METFGSRLKLAMIAAGVDVPMLARRVPVTQAMVRRWLAMDACRISGVHLLMCSEILGVRIRWLVLGGTQLQRRLGQQYTEEELLDCFRVLDPDMQRHLVDIAAVLSREAMPARKPAAARKATGSDGQLPPVAP